MAQGGEIRHGEISSVGQRGVQARGGMPLGEHEAVPVLLLRVRRVDVHLLEIKISENVRRGQGAAGMTGLCPVHGLNDALAHIIGMLLQL